MNNEHARAPLHFPTLFISDMHLGKDVAQVDMLLEFLSNVTCDKLFIVGDGIEGWGMMKKKHRKFTELEMRVFDRINAMSASGTDIVQLPGNHDENLRAHWHATKHKLKKPKPKKESHKRRKILDRTYNFIDHDTELKSAIHITDRLEYVDPKGRKMLVMHGDQLDPRYLKTTWGKALSKVGDKAYDVMIDLNGIANKVSKKYRDSNFSIAALSKAIAKKKFDVVGAFERAAISVAEDPALDGLVCGHIHTAEVHDKHGALYVNSGDWVESCTAAAHDEDGNWFIIDWAQRRRELGLGALPTVEDENPHVEFRGITHRQLKWIQRIWPAKNLDKKMSAIDQARRQLSELQRKFSGKASGETEQKTLEQAQKAVAKARRKALPYEPPTRELSNAA